MKAARSFRQTLGDLPPRYRTPSPPPREAIEPLSPGGEAGFPNWVPEPSAYTTYGLGLSWGNRNGVQRENISDQQLWLDGNGQARIDTFNSNVVRDNATRRSTFDEYKVSSRKEGSYKRDRRGHARSGSSIEALATIALATSPTFSQASPTFVQSPWPSYSYSSGYQHDHTLHERPSKRAKSEKLPSPQIGRKQSRPATSHVTSFENMKEEAELLLNFAQPHNFPPLSNATPLTHPKIEQESPSYKRLSASTTESEQTEEPAYDGDKNNGLGSRNAHEDDTLSKKMDHETVGSGYGGGHEHRVEVENGQVFAVEQPDVRGGNLAYSQPEHPILKGLTDQLAESAPMLDVSGLEEKRPRRVQPTTQAPCAKCNALQATVESGDQDGLTSWIGCNGCQRWFHIVCAGFKDSREVRTVDKYMCPDCEPTKGATTFVRKSSRARTAIDYAGLNQGMIQSSEETAEHHWLKPIKEGKIKFQPDDFARIRPEMLNTEYLERTDGMKRPIVIPACWNRQFGCAAAENATNEEGREVDEPEVLIDCDGNEIETKMIGSARIDEDEVADCGQDLLDMVMPENLTVRRVAGLHGLDLPLDVIDVKSQQTAQKWNLKKWADYYESTSEKTIRNVISLEVSQSKLGRLLRRPQIVRDLDLQDAVWPLDLPAKAVQFYCLMSVADCYTDFHIDFGGSSVYYHILKGKKTFFFIPPEDKHLKKYEQWNNSQHQSNIFLGNDTGDCSRVDLSEGDTMLIPSGWIHAVWTPENSLVVGGNFLTRMSYEMQIKISKIEADTKTPLKFRYPLFQKVNWYAAIRYLEDDPVPDEVMHEFEDDPDHVFLRANPVWHEFGDLQPDAEPGDPFYNVRFYSRAEMEGLPALRDYLYRTALIDSDFHVEGFDEAKRGGVKKSIPRGHGDSMDLIRKFGIWTAWKTGGVTAPDWVRPDSPSLASLARKAEKQQKAERTPGERMSSRVQSQMEHARAQAINSPIQRQHSSVEPDLVREEAKRPKRTPKTSGLGPQRFACDPCRKRRIRCRHREGEAFAPTAESGRARTYNTISMEIPPPVPAQLHATYDGPTSPTPAKAPEPSSSSRFPSTPVPLHEVNALNSHSTPMQMQAQDLMGTGGSSSKKGRSKACDECRKSKRRCIHDESGRVDPLKAAEPSKPRGSTSTKRPARLSDDLCSSTKMLKTDESENDTILVGHAQSALAEGFDQPAVEEDDFNSLIDPSLRPAIQQLQAAANAMNQSSDEMNGVGGSELRAENGESYVIAIVPSQAKQTIEVDPNMQNAPSVRTESHPTIATAALKTSSSQVSASSLVSPPDSLHHDDGEALSPTEHKPISIHLDAMSGEESAANGNDSTSASSFSANALQTPISARSRHSSRQPKPIDRYVPDAGAVVHGSGTGDGDSAGAKQSASKKETAEVASDKRRDSSSGASVGASQAHLTTLHANTFDGPGGGSEVKHVRSRRASSHRPSTTPFHPTIAAAAATALQHPHVTTPPPTSVGARPSFGALDAEAPEEADEESLRLIRALQEEEFGLRRRRGVRA